MSVRNFVTLLCLFAIIHGACTQPRRAALFIVPRVDGVVSAFEASSGKPLWNFSTGGPLVQSSTNGNDEPTISSIEMNIFNTIQRDGLQDLYPEAKTILGATPFMTTDGTIFLSHKQSKIFGLDPETGAVVPNEIKRTTADISVLDEQEPTTCRNLLQIVRTEHTLETHNGTSKRLLTVSHIRAFLQDCAGIEEINGETSLELSLLPALSTTRLGDLQAMDEQGNSLWIFNLPAPHSQLVYGLTANTLRAIRPATPVEPFRKVPLSLTHYKGTPYELTFGLPGVSKPLALPPPPATTNSSSKSVWYWIATACICVAATIWGLVILKYHTPGSISRPTTPQHGPINLPTSSSVPRSASTLRLREEHEILQKRLQDLLLLQQQQQERHLQQALQLQELQLQQQILQQQHQEQQEQQLQTQQSHNQSLVQSQSNSIAMSRYRSDFEEKERLGEGGFGTVFLAINKLDGVEYAVKKVCLTSGNSKENARVLREVRFLALLDHPNIIRYFQSWIEEDELDEWDECRIGSRLEYYDDDEEEEDENGDESTDSNGQVVTRDFLRERIRSDCSYEGDQSEIRSADRSDSSLAISIGLATSFSGLNGFNAHNSTSSAPGLHKKVTKKVRKDRLKQNGLDGTNERTYGSTSNPISDDSQSGIPVRSRKPILYIQMQYCHQGTLHHWLSRSDRMICEKEAIAIFRQAVQGVAHIHNHSVIHRDLKPPNILISADGSVKIGDFGLSTGGTVDTPIAPLSPTRLLSRSHTTGVGSPLYCSPEQLKGERYDSKVDIFSLGVILFEMFHIFSTQMERVTHITKLRDEGHITDQIKDLYPSLADLILQLVQLNPNDRPHAKDILEHPFLGPL